MENTKEEIKSYPLKDNRSDEERQKQLFDSIRKNVEKNMSPEQIDQMKVLGEKFHESFDITKGNVRDHNEINMEESLAYVVESIKSGMHPSYLNEDEQAILKAGFGEKWYETFGYSSDEL